MSAVRSYKLEFTYILLVAVVVAAVERQGENSSPSMVIN